MLTENQLALWRAIKANDETKSIEALENLDSIHFMVNLGYGEGFIPCVSFIITHNMNDLLERALLKEVDLTARDSKHGNTPLHWAAKENNSVAINLLVKQGSDKQALNKQNQTPMQLLASDASLEAKKALNPILSLQSLASIALGKNPQELPAHIVNHQASLLQRYDMHLKQHQENQKKMDELSKAVSSLSFVRPS